MFSLPAKDGLFAFVIMLKHSFDSNTHHMLKTSESIPALDSHLHMHIS